MSNNILQIHCTYLFYTYLRIYAWILLEWGALGDRFHSLCNALPYDCQITIDKLKTIPQLKEDREEQLSKLISSSTDVRKINAKIITYLIVKLCYNGGSDASLCGVMDELIGFTSTSDSTCIQQIKSGKSVVHS